MSKISVVITAYNEEKNIERCLKSALFADEIIVVNNNSTDKTSILAKKYTKHVYQQKNDLQKIDIQKNYGFSKATGEWILSLDADEEVSVDLANELQQIARSSTSLNSYWIPRKNIIFGKWIENTGWYPDYQLRFFKNGKGRYEKNVVHKPLTVTGEAGKLTHNLIHNNYDSIAQFIQKNYFVYAKSEADETIAHGYQFSWQDVLKFPTDEFFSRYFAREGYKDGLHGLILSLLMAGYHLCVFLYLWEEQKFQKQDISLSQVQQELLQVGKNTNYWFKHEKTKNIKNPLKKLFK